MLWPGWRSFPIKLIAVDALRLSGHVLHSCLLLTPKTERDVTEDTCKYLLQKKIKHKCDPRESAAAVLILLRPSVCVCVPTAKKEGEIALFTILLLFCNLNVEIHNKCGNKQFGYDCVDGTLHLHSCYLSSWERSVIFDVVLLEPDCDCAWS